MQTVHPKPKKAPTKAPAPRKLESGGGTKFDSGKARMELLDPYALEQLSHVLAFGAEKYEAWNWTRGIAYGRLIGAALRHLFAFAGGEDLDPESGLPHTAHAMCCLMFLTSMQKRHPELDDREGAVE